MRKMKDSGIEWIGQIPQEWNTIRAKYVTTITNGSDPKTEGNTPVYGSGSGCFRTCGEHKKGPTVLLGRKGTVDIPQYITGNYWNVDTAFDVKTVEEQLDLEFYYFASTCFDYKYYTSTTTLPSMTQTNYGNMYIPFPPVDVQRRVVVGLKEKLSGIDALIAVKEKTNALLKERRQSIIYEAVTKGLNPDAPMKDSGIEWIGEIPGNWTVGKTIYGLEMPITDGPHETPQLYSEGVPFVSAEAVSCGNGKIDFDHIRGYISEEYYDECCKKYIPQINDIYMIKSGATTGKVAIVDTDSKFTIWSPLAVFRCAGNKCHYKYLYYFLQSDAYQKQVESKWSFGTQQNIGMRTLERLIVCFPTVDEQKTIADYLDVCCSETDQLITTNEATIQKLKEYRQSIIYEAVTGKIEI